MNSLVWNNQVFLSQQRTTAALLAKLRKAQDDKQRQTLLTLKEKLLTSNQFKNGVAVKVLEKLKAKTLAALAKLKKNSSALGQLSKSKHERELKTAAVLGLQPSRRKQKLFARLVSTISNELNSFHTPPDFDLQKYVKDHGHNELYAPIREKFTKNPKTSVLEIVNLAERDPRFFDLREAIEGCNDSAAVLKFMRAANEDGRFSEPIGFLGRLSSPRLTELLSFLADHNDRNQLEAVCGFLEERE